MRTLAVLLGLALGITGDPTTSTVEQNARPVPAAAGIQVASPTPATGQSDNACPVSPPIRDRPPDDPHASSFANPNGIWYANDERTLWAWWWGKRSTGGYKVLWVRPVGAQLKVSGRRLDGDAGPLRAQIPAGYRYTYQASGLEFSTSGCWEIEATAGEARVKFVVRIP
jgi:hypothetical protein